MGTSRMPLRVSIIYASLGLLWIYRSDYMLAKLYSDAADFYKYETIKGYAFVILTTLVLYFLLKRENDIRNAIEENLMQLVNIVKYSQDAIIGESLDGTITSWNKGAEKLFGYSSSEVIGKHISIIFPDSKHSLVEIILGKIKLDEKVDNFKTKFVKSDGQEIYVSVAISPIKNLRGEVIGASTIAMDVTKQMADEEKLKLSYTELSAVYEQLSAAEEELRAQYEELQHNQEVIGRSEERYKLALDGANDVIWEWNLETDEVFLSDKWAELSGYTSKKYTKVSDIVKKLISPEDKSRVIKELKSHFKGFDEYYKSEFKIITSGGEKKWVSNRGKVLRDGNGKPYLMAGSIADITERRVKEEQIRTMAYYDPLTNLPNRVLFTDKLESELEKSRKNQEKGAVLFLDLDDFKRINDTLGHDHGDELLKNIAATLIDCLKDQQVVARFGGDEFLVLIPNINGYIDVVDILNKILHMFGNPICIRDKQVYITASIGVVLYPEDGDDTNTILKNIDTAMYKAKANGRNRYCFFDKSIGDAVLRKTELEKGLREALEKDELCLYYQPQIDIKTAQIRGVEALVRWKSNELGFISPAEFIPIAEATGLIIPIGGWILSTACRQAKKWKEQGFIFDTVSVNVSSMQLQQEDFIKTVIKVLEDEELDPEILEIEITESILMRSLDDNVKVLKELRKIGVKTALDDFGTGYSSLNYLRKLPINNLKIDKSFIDDICNDDQNKSITDGIIQLAHKINLDVIIEGVESLDQVTLLKEMECNVIQGYYFSRPLPVDEVEDLLKNGSCRL